MHAELVEALRRQDELMRELQLVNNTIEAHLHLPAEEAQDDDDEDGDTCDDEAEAHAEGSSDSGDDEVLQDKRKRFSKAHWRERISFEQKKGWRFCEHTKCLGWRPRDMFAAKPVREWCLAHSTTSSFGADASEDIPRVWCNKCRQAYSSMCFTSKMLNRSDKRRICTLHPQNMDSDGESLQSEARSLDNQSPVTMASEDEDEAELTWCNVCDSKVDADVHICMEAKKRRIVEDSE